MKKTTVISALAVAGCLLTSAAFAEPMTGITNEYGAHKGLNPETKNVDLSGSLVPEALEAYTHAGVYIVSDKPKAEGSYQASGTYYEKTSLEYGSGLYVIIQDEESTSKHYTLIKSAQNLEVGEPYCYVQGDIGGRLLDDKYTSTLMAHNYREGDYSYVSYDLSGGKLAAQQVALDENGVLCGEQAEGFIYLYLVAEKPEDYYQRLANEAAGYETPAQSQDRAYMPVNNTHSSGNPFNNWANITDGDADKNYNDRIARIGAMEGESNTRLYSYSGQNVIVAKIAVGITESTAKLTWSDNAGFDPNADYTAAEGTIKLNVGETLPLYFHTQFTSTWGRDGYANSDIEYVIEDESVISYVGNVKQEGVTPNTLTALKAGTATLKATVKDSAGKYAGGASVTLTVVVE